MTNPVGIDISAAQSATPSGDWLFIVHKATEGHDYLDPAFAGRFGPSRSQAAYVGAYHYARPLDGYTGDAQADFFAKTVLAQGFRPGQDLWQLDCEGMGNSGTTSAQWDVFVRAFMQKATAELGNRGFLYAGFYFDPAFATLRQDFPWWDPDYGPNDGSVHALPKGANPVIHQFTSFPALDRNVINDQAKWNEMMSVTAPDPALLRFLKMIASFATTPLRQGASGPRVVGVQKLLARHGFPKEVIDGKFDAEMADQVRRFKIAHGLSNHDGSVVGRPCLLALLAK